MCESEWLILDQTRVDEVLTPASMRHCLVSVPVSKSSEEAR